MKYIVKNRLTDAICGEFATYGQAGNTPTSKTRGYLLMPPSIALPLTSS